MIKKINNNADSMLRKRGEFIAEDTYNNDKKKMRERKEIKRIRMKILREKDEKKKGRERYLGHCLSFSFE